MSDHTVPPRPAPARRRPLYEGPRFWLGLSALGLVPAGALSFLPARGDTADFKPDVGAFCAQVDVLRSTDILSLVAGVTAGPLVPFAGGPTTSTAPGEVVPAAALDKIQGIQEQLVQLERVAPHEVRTDVHDVRLQIDDLITSLHKAGATDQVQGSSLFFAISDAQSQIQQAIGRMGTYVNDTCGIDLRPTSILPGSFSN